MRFSFFFLVVLAVSMGVVFFTGWGITLATSFDRLTMITSEFSSLADSFLSWISPYTDMQLEGGVSSVTSILMEGQAFGWAGANDAKAGAIATIGALVNLTSRATEQSQAKMNGVLDTFGSLVQSVVSNFKGVAKGYAAGVRGGVAARVSMQVKSFYDIRGASLQRLQSLNQLGLFSLSRAPTDPVDEADCTLLGALCMLAAEFDPGESVELALATGRLYACSTLAGGFVSNITVNGSLYNGYHRKWLPYGANVSLSVQQPMRQRCLSETPAVKQVVFNCAWPQSCLCGNDPRCSTTYISHANSSPRLVGGIAFMSWAGELGMSISYPLYNASNPLAPLGVVSVVAEFNGSSTLAQLGLSATTYVALVLNDTNLTVLGSEVSTMCAANETAPGDPALPTWSALRSCDPGLRAVGQWLWQNRSNAQPSSTLQFSGVMWNVYPATNAFISFFIVVGSESLATSSVIDASETRALYALDVVRTQVLHSVAESGNVTRAYIAAAGAQNLANIQATLDSYALQVVDLELRSKQLLQAMQNNTSTQVEQWASSEMVQIDEVKSRHLHAMVVTTGWTVAVVVAVLVVVLACSAWGTIRITHSLVDIITLMEDVAEMKVENLEVPQHSSVTEVARIQSALQVLIHQLAGYKSYMPAGLFQEEEVGEWGMPRHDTAGDFDRRNASVGDLDDLSTTCSLNNNIQLKAHPTTSVPGADATGVPKRSGSGVVSSPTHKAPHRSMAALAFNVVGAVEVLQGLSDALTKSLLNDYVARVHDAVSRSHGNVDCILGDQIFATFNAHIPCSDPAGTAVGAALDARNKLRILGDRVRFQIGVSFGFVLAGSMGYAKFKCMVAMSNSMKVASLLSHISRFHNGAILADASVEERAGNDYDMRPAELVHLPRLKRFGESGPASRRVFLVQDRQQAQGEWLYQIDDDATSADWAQTFESLVAATHLQEGQTLLQSFLKEHPDDEVALRLRDSLPRWEFGAGLPLHEGPE